MDKTVLITGGTGLVGTTLIGMPPPGFKLVATHYHNDFFPYAGNCRRHCRLFRLNVVDQAQTLGLFAAVKPDVVIHTAGISSVDYCERNQAEAFASNVVGTRNILLGCEEHGSRLIYISTNAVFDGRCAPYGEESIPNPINYYGKLKLECEKLVQNSRVDHNIARPIHMYGWPNKNGRPTWALWVIENLRQGKKLNMVNDVYENPLLSQSCAEGIWAVVQRGEHGIYHLAGRDVVNRYEFARIIAQVFGLDESLIQSVASDFFADLAPRPKNTSYVTHKMESGLGMKPVGIRDGLTYMRDHKPWWTK